MATPLLSAFAFQLSAFPPAPTWARSSAMDPSRSMGMRCGRALGCFSTVCELESDRQEYGAVQGAAAQVPLVRPGAGASQDQESARCRRIVTRRLCVRVHRLVW